MPKPPLLRSLPPLHLPSRGEMVRAGVLGLLVLAAVASTQMLPGASARDGGQDEAASGTQAEAAETRDRSAAVVTDQASSADRSLAVPSIGTDQSDNTGLAAGYQLSSPSGNPVPPRQLSVAGQDGGQLGTQRLEGDDLCDEAAPGAGPAICARPIETARASFPDAASPSSRPNSGCSRNRRPPRPTAMRPMQPRAGWVPVAAPIFPMTISPSRRWSRLDRQDR